jgi:hypothetical protein
MNGSDPLQRLQAAARAAAEHYSAGHPARRVIVLGEDGAKLIDANVPLCACQPAPAPEPDEVPGWAVRNGRAYFDGTLVPISGRKLDVLRVLIDKEVASVDDLRAAWADYRPEDSSVRWTVTELRKALKAAFSDFDGELIQTTGHGYALTLK